MQEVQLGDHVKDKFTGFSGIAMGRSKYLTGCDQILISPDSLDKDGDIRKGNWFDIDRIEVIEQGRFAHTADNPGGPDDHGALTK